MKVKLVGANLELEQVDRALREPTYRPHLSPEPIAAAYARISRSEKTVEQLRQDARENVEKARRSNRNIVFEMGHSSIAEHATFNFDMEGISRLAIEAVEHSRLASYTERSQRYVLIGSDMVVPDEVAHDESLRTRFVEAFEAMSRGYRSLVDGLLEHQLREAGGAAIDKERRREIDTATREDARYLLPLATAGQLGMTLNARSLENMVRRLKGHPLAEVRRVGGLLEEEALAVTPSLIRHTDPWRWVPPDVSRMPGTFGAGSVPTRGRASLLHVTPAPASLLAAGACFEATGRFPVEAGNPGDDSSALPDGGVDGGPRSGDAPDRYESERGFGPLVQTLADAWFSGAGVHAPAPRSFELVDFLFELTCSAACFGQLKRHRMATLLVAPYDADLAPVVPPSVVGAGLTDLFLACLETVRPLRDALRRDGNPAAEYLFANAHCRKMLFKTNLRELVHVSRLRLDHHAQWEIRELVSDMCALASSRLPEVERWLCGKDVFGAGG
ncbi:MAG: FAD-dependent thymidylate synthase [Deltaproteobacteria bacterium]|nr:FAD-dependent thymidylate synthase [Deltaproteobacteria bacterium]